MRKKFFNVCLLGALLATPAVTFVSCNDYDDDIDNLQEQIDGLTTSYKALQTKIDNGFLITNVEQVSEGVKLTFSDGNTTIVPKGADGQDADVWTIDEATGNWAKNGVVTSYQAIAKDGKDGKDADVWTITSDGYWALNGVATSVKAEAKDGTDADVWTITSDGYWAKNGVATTVKAEAKDGTSTNGTDGKNGDIYVPNKKTGNFDIYVEGDSTNVKDSGISYIADGALTAVVASDGTLTISNVKQTDGSYGTWVFNQAVITDLQALVDQLLAQIQSIAFVPQYEDAQGNVIVPAYSYVSAQKETYNPASPVQFLVKPADAAKKLPAVAKYLSLVGSTELQTRAAATATGAVESLKLTDEKQGIITVNATFDFGKAVPTATAKYPFALVVADKDSTSSELSSDYFTVVARDLAQAQKAIDSIPGLTDTAKPEAYNLLTTDGQTVALSTTKTGDVVSIYYNTFEQHKVANELKSVLTLGGLALSELDNSDQLEIVQVYAGSAAVALKDASSKKATDTGYEWKKYFAVDANGVTMVKGSDGNAQTAAIGQTVKVVVADKRFGHTDKDKKVYTSLYEITYKAIDRQLDVTFKTIDFKATWSVDAYTTPSRIGEFKLAPEDINDADVAKLQEYNLTKEQAYNLFAAQLKVANNSETTAITKTVTAGNGATDPEQYTISYYTKSGAQDKRDTIVAVVIVLKTANYSVSPADTTNTIAVKDGTNVIFNAKLPVSGTFTYGDERFYDKYSQRWTPQSTLDKLSASFNWADVKKAYESGADYAYDSICITDAFLNYEKYSDKSTYNVQYQFFIEDYEDKAAKTAPVKINLNTINLDDNYYLSAQEDKYYLRVKDRIQTAKGDTIDYSDVELSVKAIDGGGYEISEDPNNKPFSFHIDLVLPLDEKDLVVKDTTLSAHLINGVPVNVNEVVNAVSTKLLTSEVPATGVVFVKNGVLQSDQVVVGKDASGNNILNPYGAYVMGWKPSLKYEIVSAVNGTNDPLPASQVSLDATTGALTITDTGNVKNQCTVVVKVTLDYKFATLAKTFTVTIPAQGE
jgi:hypothetical protein